MKKQLRSIFFIAFSVFLCMVSICAENETVTPEIIAQLEQSFDATGLTNQEIHNVLNDIRTSFSYLETNQSFLNQHNWNFTYEIQTPRITDQMASGRCWIYAGLNILRPYVLEKTGDVNFEFSQNYLYFWSKIERANAILEEAIKRSDKDVRSFDYNSLFKSPMSDGASWYMFLGLIKKYGIVPKKAMPETIHSKNSDNMNGLLNTRIIMGILDIHKAKIQAKPTNNLKNIKLRTLQDIYYILALHLGKPPKSFIFKYADKVSITYITHYTPQTFAKEFIIPNLDDMILLVNWPGRNFYTYYTLENPAIIDWANDLAITLIDGPKVLFLNVPIEDMENSIVNSIKNNEPVWFAAAMRYFSVDDGIGSRQIYKNIDTYEKYYKNILPDLNKSDKLVSGLINPNHAMAIIGVDIGIDGKIIKWKVENSWGAFRGNHGIFAFYDDWFNEFVTEAAVNEKYLPEHLKDILKTKIPVVIMKNGEFVLY